ncbi:hypothetical protein [Xanthomonas euvesicatoria]|uniref:DUF2939 domain-containing protein n=1 Tax=Xanthomonas euvesicatoria TaxID=456327 RepID=A0AAW3U2U3_XANEU|nr:hypothetical protein [Xanthomonas euvesicatoria]MBB4723351.1 hypothetical protein [Xanthomonas euvesicatoria]MBB4870137.1 hypothetical protein [Xanthomonas euvesicatoria]
MDFLQQHWGSIAANSWLFISWSLIVGGVTWTVIHFLYKHRLDLYKHRSEEDAAEIKKLQSKLSELKEERSKAEVASSLATPIPNVAEKYDYPDAGDYGMNILGQTLTDLVVGQTYSMTAKVPLNGVLKVHLTGTPPVYLEEMAGAWGYNVSTRNWQGSRYDERDHTQIFTAKGGDAELGFEAWRPGKITISVYEGGRTPAWEKVLKAVEPNGR